MRNELLIPPSGRRYTVDAVIAQTSGSVVSRGMINRTGESVAFKMFRTDFSKKGRNERDLHASVNHPTLIAYKHPLDYGDTLGMVLELAEGGNLLTKTRETGGKLQLAEVAPAVLATGAALQYLHEEGVVHKDVKPGNMLVTNQGVKLADLGSAVPLGTNLDSNELEGTPLYLAPEVARGKGIATPAIDVYSLACTTFHLLTGRPVFDGENLIGIATAHTTQTPPGLEDALGKQMTREYEPYQEPILHALQKDPKERPPLEEYLASLEEAKKRGEQIKAGVVFDLKSKQKGRHKA